MALFKLWAAELEREPTVLSEAIRSSLQVFGYDRVKPAQAEAVQAIPQGQHVFVNLPTGYGKSLIYQMLPFCTSFLLESMGKVTAEVPVVLVVSPLIALMQDQAHKLEQVPWASSMSKPFAPF